MSTSSRFRVLYALLLVPVVIGGAQGGCKCKQETETVDTRVVETVRPEDPLGITSIEPSKARPNVEMSGRAFGSGFKDGVKLDIGGQAVNTVFVDSNTLRVRIPGLAAGVHDVTATNPDGTTATLRRAYSVEAGIDDCKFVTVNFDYDKDNLKAEFSREFDKRMTCYKTAGSISVDGHADERGTTEYNLALGERRAETVKRYLTNGGVAAGKIRTTSYGEERPVATGGDESAWAKNRRAEVSASE